MAEGVTTPVDQCSLVSRGMYLMSGWIPPIWLGIGGLQIDFKTIQLYRRVCDLTKNVLLEFSLCIALRFSNIETIAGITIISTIA